MMKNRTAFLTAIYPIDNEYVEEFFFSLDNQTVNSFDLVIINDGFLGLKGFKEKYKAINIIELKPGDSVAKNRELLIKYAIRNSYEHAIFGDIDDKFEENRVELIEKLLIKYDVVVNDLTTFSSDGIIEDKSFSSRVKNNSEIDIDFILDKNIFGMSNTAINLKDIEIEKIVFHKDLIAIDWYFFSHLLIQDKMAVFTNETVTYYRQHDSNTVGIGAFSRESLHRSIKVKMLHYQYMVQSSTKYISKMLGINDLARKIKCDIELEKLMRINNKFSKNLLWWEVLEEKI